MAVTIQQIADLAGVSRGTVDRALNNRGRIDPEVAERILKIADELGYVPRKNRKNRSAREIRIGVVTQLADSSFMIEVNRGIRRAQEELQEKGVQILLKEGFSVDEKEQLAAIDELVQQDIDALAMMPVDCQGIREKINWLTEEKQIPVVTFNSDIVGTKRTCFVGMDNDKSGRTAAGLLGMLTRGLGKILIITGFFTNNVNNSRVDSFIDELKRSYPQLELVGVQGSYDNSREVQRIVENAMMTIPGISGILVVSGGQEGVGRAFRNLSLDRRPYVVFYDQTPENEQALAQDTADFLIDQNGYLQGYQPPHILYQMLAKGQNPEQEYLYTDINIITRYSMTPLAEEVQNA